MEETWKENVLGKYFFKKGTFLRERSLARERFSAHTILCVSVFENEFELGWRDGSVGKRIRM